MKATRYLNGILTVLAVLLALQLLTTWASGPSMVATAQAQARQPGAVPPGGLPDVGAQRKEIIDLLKMMVKRTEEQTEYLKSGQMKVRVEKIDDDKAKP